MQEEGHFWLSTPFVIVDWKIFQMMPYISKLRKFHWTIGNRFCTTRQKPGGGGRQKMGRKMYIIVIRVHTFLK